MAVAKSKSKSKSTEIVLKDIQRRIVSFRIVGTSPLIQHQWGEKAKQMMREKHAGKKTKTREARDPQKEFKEAAYRNKDGAYCLPAMALKKAIIAAAHKDLGIEKTLVRKSLFLICDDDKLIPMDCDEPELVEDMVRVGQGSADLRYRPYFHRWSADVECEIDAELLTMETLCILVNRAGFGVGIGEWRPEKEGEYGRFEIDRTRKVEERSA